MNIPETFPCVIPARYESCRFPGKPLKMIDGKSMISRVYDNAMASKLAEPVVVATDDERIYDHCKEEGMNVVYTSSECENGSVRVAEVAETMNEPYFFELQGDQPLVNSAVIDEFLAKARKEVVEDSRIDIVQPYAPVTPEMIQDKDVVKVVVSKSGKFLTFTRHPLETGYRTLGLYLWKREPLLKFNHMEISELEKAETCHLVRFVLNDLVVQGIEIDDTNWIEADRPEHIAQIEKIIKEKKV